MDIKELEKKYKNVCKLEDGNFCVSTKSQNEMPYVTYSPYKSMDRVFGMEGKWGLVDKDGNVIIKPKYLYPFLECGDNYQVMMPRKYRTIYGRKTIVSLEQGLIDKKGNVIIPIQYLHMEVMDNTGTYFRVEDAKTWKAAVIDKYNNIVVPFYDYIEASPEPELMVKTKYCDLYPDYIYQVKVSNNGLYGVYDLKLKKRLLNLNISG